MNPSTASHITIRSRIQKPMVNTDEYVHLPLGLTEALKLFASPEESCATDLYILTRC